MTNTETILTAIIVVQLVVIIVQQARVYGSVPQELLPAILDYAGKQAARTPSPLDDEAVEIGKKIVSVLNTLDPAQRATAGPPEIGDRG